MEYEKNSDKLYVKVAVDDHKRNIPNNQALKSGDAYYSDLHSAEKNTTMFAAESEDNSDQGAGGRWCTWKVTAIVFISLTVLLLITVLTTGGIWLRESDVLAVSQKTSMERAKQRQEEEEQKRVEREREIRAEEEKKREERERVIREEEEKKRADLEQQIRREEEEKREALERLLGERDRRLKELKAQCNSGQIISINSTGLGVLLPLIMLINCLADY